MFDNKDNIEGMLRTPLNISHTALSEIESRLAGNKVIADPNSPFCLLLEFGSSLACANIQNIDSKYNSIYPSRARTMEDLYQHMSDFDYLRMYSTPSTARIRIAFPKPYLFEKSLDFSTTSKKVTIPRNTVFQVGKYQFGIYYPIDILINKFTKSYTVVHDTTVQNPLYKISKNIVDKYDIQFSGMEMLLIDFPIYQFSRSVIEEPIVPESGYAKSFSYNNSFYAVRIFHYKNGKYHELNQTQSFTVYDVNTPTAILRVYPDKKKFNVYIPQVYFDTDMIGSKLYMEVYTTVGALDIFTSNISSKSIMANFALKDKDTTEYSNILKNFPYDLAIKLSSNKIQGGSDAVTQSTLRDRVVSDTLYERTPITEDDLKVYAEDKGFYIKKTLDDTTDRVFHAYMTLTDGKGEILPSLTLVMRMLRSYSETCSTIRSYADNTMMVLPTTIYRYEESSNDVVPLTDDELLVFSKYTKQELVDKLNSEQHLRTPFHLKFDFNESKPICTSFNLMTPDITKLIFELENYTVSEKINVANAYAQHLKNGVGGYQVLIAVLKSDDMKKVAESDIKIYVSIKTKEGNWVGTEAYYVGEDSATGQTLYAYDITTDYHINEYDELEVTNFQQEDITLPENFIPLDAPHYIVPMVRKDAIASYQEASQTLSNGVPQSYLGEYVALTRQYIQVHLGHTLIDVVDNNVEIANTSRIYATWDRDVQDTYAEDEFARDADGVPTYKIEDGKIILDTLHKAGDPKVDEYGNPVMLHTKGDVMYDDFGQPILSQDRNIVFYTDVMFLDAKIYASERLMDKTFIANLQGSLESYFDTIRELQSNLLERTKMYFRCVRSTGTAKFNMGDGLISTQNLEMSFSMNCYVPSYVKKDTKIQEIIRDQISSAIESAIKTKTISMLDIFEDVKEKMGDYIDHFTLLGINGDTTNQTFIIMNEDAQPSVKKELVLTDDNNILLQKSININFIALESNTETETYN